MCSCQYLFKNFSRAIHRGFVRHRGAAPVTPAKGAMPLCNPDKKIPLNNVKSAVFFIYKKGKTFAAALFFKYGIIKTPFFI